MVRLTSFMVFLILVLALAGCPGKEAGINQLVFSDKYSQGVIGGYARFLLNFPEEKAGTSEWEQQEISTGEWIPFISTLYEIRGIARDKYPEYPNYYYIFITPKKEEDVEGKRAVERQILTDLKENSWDMNGDIIVDEDDLQVVVEAASQPRGEVDEADMAQATSLLGMLPPPTAPLVFAVEPSSKVIITWGRVK